VKKIIAIFCFAALLLSTSSLSYFYWLQEQLHEQERFASIDAGQFDLNNTRSRESKEYSTEYYNDVDSDDDTDIHNNDHSNNHDSDQITITVKDKTVLPKGYQWEEQGREFSYKGMFYDIVSIEQTKEGWVIKAASDEEEAAIVTNQHKVQHLNKEAESKSSSSKIKLNLSLAVYECPSLNKSILINYTLLKKKYPLLTTPILSSYSGAISHPPETV
jgi:hypothetical protein